MEQNRLQVFRALVTLPSRALGTKASTRSALPRPVALRARDESSARRAPKGRSASLFLGESVPSPFQRHLQSGRWDQHGVDKTNRSRRSLVASAKLRQLL